MDIASPIESFLKGHATCFGSLSVSSAQDAMLAGHKTIGGSWWSKSRSPPKFKPMRSTPLSYATVVANKGAATPSSPSVSGLAPYDTKEPYKCKSIIDCLLSEAASKERTTESHELWGKFVSCLENGLLNGAKQKYIRRGLRNNANLCYLNAVIQSVLPCSALMQLLSHCSSDSTRPFTTMLWRVCKEFNDRRNRIPQQAAPVGEAFSVIMLEPVKHILDQWETFGAQQDAGEFLFYILNGMHEECKWKTNEALPSIGRATSQSDRDDSSDWNEVGKSNRKVEVRCSGLFEDSPIQRIFGGVMRSVVRGKNAKADSVTLELFTQLNLDISAPSVSSVQDTLAHMCTMEHIDSKTKRNTFQQLPPLLILNLKRFAYDLHGVQKIRKAIRYDEKMKFDPSLIAPEARQTSLEYTLMAVICHHGERADVGHYTAMVRYNDSWFLYDDASVRAINIAEVTSQHYAAYLLLYQSNAPKVCVRSKI